MKRYLLTAILGLVIIASCKKDEPVATTTTSTSTTGTVPKTKKTYIGDSSWIWFKATIDPAINLGAGATTDFYASLPSYVRDNRYKFNIKDSTMITLEGKTKFATSHPDTFARNSYEWRLTNPTKQDALLFKNAIIPNSSAPFYWVVETCDANLLQFFFYYELGGKTYKVSVQANHK